MNQHLCGGLAGCVWVGWGQDACLKKIIRIVSNLSINLISGDMDELLDADFLRALQNDMCSIDIGVCE